MVWEGPRSNPGPYPDSENTGQTELSETGGPTSCPGSDPVASLRQHAQEDLQRVWKSIRRMETLSDDSAESKTGERALAFVNKTFAELESDSDGRSIEPVYRIMAL